VSWWRLSILFVVVVVVAGLVAACHVDAWSNGPDKGNGFGAHDWILVEAADLASSRGAGWVNLNVALPQTDNPDTVFQDFRFHAYNRLGGRSEGGAPQKVELYYAKALSALRAGKTAAASKWVGIMSHYFADVCSPLATAESTAEELMRSQYEAAVEDRTDAPDKNDSWVRSDGAKPVSSPRALTVKVATQAHMDYSRLVSTFNRSGFDPTVQAITIRSLDRAANGLAHLLVNLRNDAHLSSLPTYTTLDAASWGVAGDGSADDTQTLQAVMSAAARRGLSVFLPRGVYRSGTGWSLPDGVDLRGSGAASWLQGPVTGGSRSSFTDLRLGSDSEPYVVPSRSHDVVYENCTFTGGGATTAVLTINQPCYNIVFRNCTIDASPYNGVSINSYNGNIHDIRFEGCHFLSAARMGFEVTNRPDAATAGWKHIDLIDCVFEPSGSEAVSYDGDGGSGNSLIKNVVIKGAGNGPGNPFWNSAWTWRQAFEINGPTNMTMDHLTVYLSYGATLNLNGPPTGDCGWKFINCNFDMSQSYLTCSPLVGYDSTGYGPPILFPNNMRHAVFANCTFNTGTNVRGRIADLVSSNGNNDFSTCTFTGNDHVKVRERGSTGNTWPAGTVFD
jgi:Pectate lyase superfamily protein